MYKLLSMNGKVFGVCKEENGVMISFPLSPDNTDYQAYLKWLAEGNTPTPADGE